MALGRRDRRDRAQRAHDSLGLIHHERAVVLAALHFPARIFEHQASTRPVFADAADHRRFRTWPDRRRARSNRRWGYTVDLRALERGAASADGCPERVTREIPGGDLPEDGRFELDLLGAVEEALGEGPDADDAYAAGYLENELTSACYTLTTPPADFSDLQPDQVEAHLKWYAKAEGYRAGAMFALTERFDELLREDGRVPHTVRTELRGRLDELRTWRNALCHGAWFGFSGAGAGVLSHYYRERKRTVRFPPMVTLKDLVDLRARIVDATIRVVEASAVAGSGSALAVVLARKFEPRNREPEQE